MRQFFETGWLPTEHFPADAFKRIKNWNIKINCYWKYGSLKCKLKKLNWYENNALRSAFKKLFLRSPKVTNSGTSSKNSQFLLKKSNFFLNIALVVRFKKLVWLHFLGILDSLNIQNRRGFWGHSSSGNRIYISILIIDRYFK